MGRVWKSRIFRLGLILVTIIMLLVFGVFYWLTSGIGKGLIESRLSSAMGRPVRLDGNFSIDLLPLPGVAGSDLLIFSRDGHMYLLNAGEYMARVELWSLLKGEVEVVALRVSNAAMDVGVLAGEASSAEQSGTPLSGLPSIQNFELRDTRVYLDGMDSEPYLRIDNFYLGGFSVGGNSMFRFDAALIWEGEQPLGIKTSGQLILSEASVMDVQLSDLDISHENWLIEEMEGEISAGLSASGVVLRLRWMDAEQRFTLLTRLNQDPGYPDARTGLEIEYLEVSLDEHVISGDGCVILLDPPVLHLDLKAPSMEMGDIASLAEKWKAPGAALTASADSADELPIELALRLVVDRANYEDTVAEGVRITAGSEPDCPERL